MSDAPIFNGSDEPTGATDSRRVMGKSRRSVPVTPPSLPDRFQVQRFAGAGGMGSVYRARDTLLNREVAIKFLAHGGAGRGSGETGGTGGAGGAGGFSGGAFDRLVREARAMAAFSHPGVCRVLDVVASESAPFMVMEWIDGVPLHEAWRDLSVDDRLAMFTRIVGAVAAAHAAGNVHRDLKPLNILVNNAGDPIIVDFGLASGVGDSGGTGYSGGTPGYAAPEQFAPVIGSPSSPVGPPADVFALGVILYELLTNRRPFEADTAQEIIRLTREHDVALPEDYWPQCPASLQRICLAALERDPARRYPSAGELAADLERYRRGETVAARPSRIAERFVEQIEAQVLQTRQWAKLGFVTEREAADLRRRLRDLQRPESPWIVDSRRLSHSQVALYLGGWLVLAALTVGLWRAWASLTPLARVALPSVAAASLLLGGVAMHVVDRRRVALIYLVTACLATPVAVGLMLRETRWMSGDGVGSGVRELFGRAWHAASGWQTREPPPQGLFNAQLLSDASVWLCACALLRLFTSSGAFSLLGSTAAMLTWTGVWLARGNLSPERDGDVLAHWGAFTLPLCALMIVTGCVLSSAENSSRDRLGHHRERRADAWPLLTIGVIGAVGSLALIAFNQPDWLGLPQIMPPDGPFAAKRAAGFMVNGLVIWAVSWLLSRGSGSARERLVLFLRWILPSHVLAPMLWLHIEDVWRLGRVWLIVTAALAVAFCFWSVWKQWKPFVVNGLVYFALAYSRVFDDPDVLEHPTARVWLAVGMLVLGLCVMVAAWWLPDRLATERSRRMISRVRDRLRTSMAGRRPPA